MQYVIGDEVLIDIKGTDYPDFYGVFQGSVGRVSGVETNYYTLLVDLDIEGVPQRTHEITLRLEDFRPVNTIED